MKRAYSSFLVAMGLLVLCSGSYAAPGPFYTYKFCFLDLVLIEERIPPIIVGCEVVDCCPGCPGPPPIDWRIRFTGRPFRSVDLKFENLSLEVMKGVKIKGEAKWMDENTLRVDGGGDVILSGFRADAKGRPPVAHPRIVADEKMMKEAMDAPRAAGDSSDELGRVELAVDQLSGAYIVNEYKLAYVIWRCFPPPRPFDKIDLNNNIGNDNAVVFLDARRSAGCVNDEIRRGNDIINVGSVLSNGGCNSEVAVFSDDNAMALVTPVNVWTNPLGDILPVNLAPLLQAPVAVRLLTAGVLARAQGDIANANFLYNSNNAGIGFNATFQDLSGNQAAVNLVGTNAGAMCSNVWLNALTTSAFFTPGRLNVYYVNGAFTGLTCIFNPNIIVVGTTANNQTLAHEFGHSFSLGHTNNLAGFGTNNVMVGGGALRTHFSEGQDFRMNANAGSTLNTNGVRVGPTRNCPDGTTSSTCPLLSLDAIPN